MFSVSFFLLFILLHLPHPPNPSSTTNMATLTINVYESSTTAPAEAPNVNISYSQLSSKFSPLDEAEVLEAKNFFSKGPFTKIVVNYVAESPPITEIAYDLTLPTQILASSLLSSNTGSNYIVQLPKTMDAAGLVTTSFLLSGLKITSEKVGSDRVIITGDRPATNVLKEASEMNRFESSSFLKPKAVAQPAKKLIKFDMNDDDLDENDESALLDLAPPPPNPLEATKGGDDCSGRKPCDNCSCGRAEALAGGSEVTVKDVKDKLVQAPSSGCGACGKGDAFRCASCPYLGKPSFKEGEGHLVLNLVDDI